MSVHFFVDGVPAPQGSKNAWVNKATGRAVMFDQGVEKLRPWRALVSAAALAATDLRFDEPVEVVIGFALTRPKSVKRLLPSVKPDVDKLARAVLDGLTASSVIRDDAQVVRLVASKVYADRPGASVSIRPIPTEGEPR